MCKLFAISMKDQFFFSSDRREGHEGNILKQNAKIFNRILRKKSEIFEYLWYFLSDALIRRNYLT